MLEFELKAVQLKPGFQPHAASCEATDLFNYISPLLCASIAEWQVSLV